MNEYILIIEQKDNEVYGYIYDKCVEKTNKENGYIHLDNIKFKPLTVLGDLKFIVEDMELNLDENFNMSINRTFLFKAPYEIEKIFGISFDVSGGLQYFCLLKELKKIVVEGKKISISDMNLLGTFLKIPISYNLSQHEKLEKTNEEIAEKMSICNSTVFGLSEFENMCNQRNNNCHIYECSCSSVAEMVFYTLYYLVLFNYRFFKCQFCKKYSAIKKSKGTNTYCSRMIDLSVSRYKDLSCKEVVPKILDNIRTKKDALYHHLYDKGHYKKLDKFLEGYGTLNDLFKEERSYENLLNLNNYIDKNSVRKMKKNN